MAGLLSAGEKKAGDARSRPSHQERTNTLAIPSITAVTRNAIPLRLCGPQTGPPARAVDATAVSAGTANRFRHGTRNQVGTCQPSAPRAEAAGTQPGRTPIPEAGPPRPAGVGAGPAEVVTGGIASRPPDTRRAGGIPGHAGGIPAAIVAPVRRGVAALAAGVDRGARVGVPRLAGTARAGSTGGGGTPPRTSSPGRPRPRRSTDLPTSCASR